MEASLEPADDDIDFAALLVVVRRRWRLVGAVAATALLLAVVYLNIVPYRYTIQMRVIPTSSGSSDGLSSKLSQFGGLAAAAGVALPDSGGSLPFKLYVEGLHSRDVANALARDPAILHGVFYREWDSTAGRWRPPSAFAAFVSSTVKPLLGVPPRPWQPPGAARLQTWMNDQIGVDQNLKNPAVTVSILSRDPAFGIEFMTKLDAANDALLRQRALQRADDYIRYLAGRLPTVTLAEQRVAIAQSLGEQERVKMIAGSNRPFSAELFDHPAASEKPETPDPVKTIGIAVVLGLLAGAAAALITRNDSRTTRAIT